MNAGAFESVDTVQGKPTVARTGGQDDSAPVYEGAIVEFQCVRARIGDQSHHSAGYDDTCAELLGLHLRAVGQIPARDAKREAQVVLDA